MHWLSRSRVYANASPTAKSELQSQQLLVDEPKEGNATPSLAAAKHDRASGL